MIYDQFFKRLFRREVRHADGYAALGDSISIDDYTGYRGGGAASLLYRNLPRWSESDGQDLATRFPDWRFLLLAADGATSQHVLTSQLTSLARSGVTPRLVTLTCGGNDLLSLYGASAANGLAAAQAFAGRLGRIITDIKALADPDALILVGNIYDPTDGVGDVETVGGAPWPDGMALFNAFNAAIADTVARHAVRLIDIHRHFLGHGLHHADRSHPHYHPDDPSGWYEAVIEPNARGAHEIRRLFWEEVERWCPYSP
jgi:lysophospholipase L1-like esterase